MVEIVYQVIINKEKPVYTGSFASALNYISKAPVRDFVSVSIQQGHFNDKGEFVKEEM